MTEEDKKNLQRITHSTDKKKYREAIKNNDQVTKDNIMGTYDDEVRLRDKFNKQVIYAKTTAQATLDAKAELDKRDKEFAEEIKELRDERKMVRKLLKD